MPDRLDPDAIADAAVALADARGIDAVSMRSVGGALGVSGMALYRHVTGRDDLMRRMVVRVAQTLPHVLADASWRRTLEHLALTEWAAFGAHPWLADTAVSAGRLVDATSAVDTGIVLGRLVAAGCTPDRAEDVFVGTAALAIGVARITHGGPGRVAEYPADADADAPAGSAELAQTPTLAARFRAHPLDHARGEHVLRTVLAAYLDGVEASLSRPARAHETCPRKESS